MNRKFSMPDPNSVSDDTLLRLGVAAALEFRREHECLGFAARSGARPIENLADRWERLHDTRQH